MTFNDKGHRTFQVVSGSANTSVVGTLPGRVCRLKGLVVCNFSSSADTVWVYVVQSGDSPSDKNTILRYTLSAEDTIADCDFDIILRSGDTVVTKSTNGNRISVAATVMVL